jgi:hypothetical protein
MENASGIVNAILGDWQTSGLLVFSAGQPFTVVDGISIPGGEARQTLWRILSLRAQTAQRRELRKAGSTQQLFGRFPIQIIHGPHYRVVKGETSCARLPTETLILG